MKKAILSAKSDFSCNNQILWIANTLSKNRTGSVIVENGVSLFHILPILLSKKKIIFVYRGIQGSPKVSKVLLGVGDKMVIRKSERILVSSRHYDLLASSLGEDQNKLNKIPDFLHICHLNNEDIGGQSGRLSRAIKQYTKTNSDSFYKLDSYLGFKSERKLIDAGSMDIINKADILFFNEAYVIEPQKEKYNIIYHRGSDYRNNPDYFLLRDKEMDLVLVSTLDLLSIDEMSLWLPSISDIEKIESFRKKNKEKSFIIAHTATSRNTRNTDIIVEAIHELREEGCDVRLALVEGLKHEEALKIKGSADASFDHMSDFSYGNGTIEAMAMGIPVIKKYFKEEVTKEFFGYIPYITVKSKADIKTAIRRLMVDKKYYDRYSDLGKKHVARYHGLEICAKRLEWICHQIYNGKQVSQRQIIDFENANQPYDWDFEEKSLKRILG